MKRVKREEITIKSEISDKGKRAVRKGKLPLSKIDFGNESSVEHMVLKTALERIRDEVSIKNEWLDSWKDGKIHYRTWAKGPDIHGMDPKQDLQGRLRRKNPVRTVRKIDPRGD